MTKHGGKAGGSVRPEYVAWQNMRERCGNPNRPDFARYGGRGISVAPEWADDFPAFLAEIGPRPSPRHSIDRIDNADGYRPGNVRWATAVEQRANRRDSRGRA